MPRPKSSKQTPDLRSLLVLRQSGLPKYLQLRQALASAISAGHWKAGAQIPTEEELTEATGMSKEPPAVIVEERIYTCHVGKAQQYVGMYEAEGFAIQRPILGHLVGYFTTELGPLNQVVHMWAYESMEDRAASSPPPTGEIIRPWCTPVSTPR